MQFCWKSVLVDHSDARLSPSCLYWKTAFSRVTDFVEKVTKCACNLTYVHPFKYNTFDWRCPHGLYGLRRWPQNTAFPVREPRGTSAACHSPALPVVSLLSTSFHLLQNLTKHNYFPCSHDRQGCRLTSLAKIIQGGLKSAPAGILLAQLADAPASWTCADLRPLLTPTWTVLSLMCRNFNPVR